MVGGSMSVLDIGGEQSRDTALQPLSGRARQHPALRKEPPFAYVIPSVQRDPGEAALLAQKFIDNGLEVHCVKQKFQANGREYPAGSWVILMDQPYAPLAKELFEPQVYPINGDPGKPLDLPYDVTGWTLSMQMGVETSTITTPVTSQQRAALEKIDRATPPTAPGAQRGPVRAIGASANASYRMVNEVFGAGGAVSLTRDGTFVLTGVDGARLAAISQRLSVPVASVPVTNGDKPPRQTTPLRKARVALYRPWVASIDEGWTRWILENYGFAPVNVYNADIQAGHLRERFNALIIPDMSKATLMEGHKPGTVPGEYAGGIGDTGLDALREFVTDGGSLIAFNAAAPALIDLLKLPVANILEGVKSEQFFCSGALLRVELRDPNRPEVAGLPREPDCHVPARAGV